MVGAPSSNRCGVCKHRRVKCDEAWPTCGPCRKGNRQCPGPPERTIRYAQDYPFGKKQQHTQDANTASNQLVLRTRKPGASSRSKEGRNLHMIPIHVEKKDGGMFQKIRLLDTSIVWKQDGISSLARPLPLSPADSLASRLHTFLQWEEHGGDVKVPIRGVWLRQLPQRFGTSPALDHAISCLIASHEAVARGDNPSTWLDFKQYGKALKSLQHAIDRPNEQLSTNTVAAVAVMWRIEGVLTAIDGKNHEQAIHARALLQMFRAKGTRAPTDKLEFFLMLECHIAAVQDSLNHDIPEPCFFDSDEWRAAFQEQNLERHGRTETSALYWGLVREWVRYPGLLHDIMLLYINKDNPPVTTEAILGRAVDIAQHLEALWHGIYKVLDDPNVRHRKPSPTGDPLVPIVFVFPSAEFANLVSYLCFTSITIHRMIIHLSSILPASDHSTATAPPSDRAYDLPNFTSSQAIDDLSTLFTRFPNLPLPLSPGIVDTIRLRNLQVAHTVWMMYDQVRQWKPVGCLFYLVALKVSLPWAPSREMTDWVLKAAEDIEEFLPNKTGWDLHRVELFCQVLSGERLDPLLYRSMNLGQRWGYGGIGEEGFVRI
ncbi:hypothetical protein B0J11DRAFT_523991 [Dendryphion nanum]|uniref:Zn(2)-C6 fungal-type domain-containing protein n=1 Tax=Dendryphion nanum TaxID=256645 RepID=A0A9P9ISF7_9PLEO|nr:hypothetical protein B0J11DRAFT_523991 [Dendryphion nanum]